ncbi:MAG: DNA processing protein DprA, partial [Thermosynechococcaceae cyanobacterium]
METDRAFWLAWSQVAGVGPVLLHRLIEQFGSLSMAWIAPADQLQLVSGIGGKTLSAILTQRQSMDPQQLLV